MRRPSWMLSTWALLGPLAAGCGASHSHVTWSEDPPPTQEMSFAARPPPPPPAPSPTEDPKGFAARYANPAVCEAAARRLQGASRDEAWDGLKACIEHTPFTQLNALLGRAWAQDLSVRPEGAKLIARVVAQRGGSVPGELRYLQEKQIPIFSLASAMDRPDTYKGRYVLLRAQVADQRSEGERPTVWLVEHALSSVQTEEAVGYGERMDSATAYSGDLSGQTVLTGPGQLGGTVSSAQRSSRTTTRRFVENISDETGREALGRLARADPFLETRRDYVILARFDGIRLTSGGPETDDEAPRIPVLTIVSYHAPQPLVVY
ncbi:hypothetical protein [Comamonas sp. JC664]|uniref:hypothetical protein n=1 Tax=Comamonas sp. JC664 TaxID=2801917 RepID=UPI00174D8D1A|nr:hypothetical protein [Comamonas sp. JC664]MBL0694612.1 hypothetical protein [Comamonas sp. JC664]GHG96250.1 hypothetical protein GCM10012319_60570 [Comamonas sp. KCTC 72670]